MSIIHTAPLISGCQCDSELSGGTIAAIRLVEHLDDMQDAFSFAVEARAGRKLQHASRIGRYDEIRLGPST